MKYPNRFNANNVISEAALTSAERNSMDDSEFGIPELRKYPLNDEVHVLQAVRFFKDAPEDERKQLAKRIIDKANEYNMDHSNWETVNRYAESVYNESWNDLKNGVNSNSKKLFFHISFDDDLDGKTLSPRIPSYLTNDDIEKDEDYYEENKTPRVCFSNSIEGCLNAIINADKRIHLGGKEIYVYIPEKPFDAYKHKTNKDIIRDKTVFDANITNECWILEDVKLKLYGTIIVDQVTKKKICRQVTSSDNKTARHFFKWHWQVKPSVIKEQYTNIKKEDETMISRFQESDIDFTQEGMFDAGFNNLRFRIAEALGDKFNVSNIVQAMGSRENKFTVAPNNNPSKYVDVISTGNGVKVPGFITSVSLFHAFDALLNIFRSEKFVAEAFEVKKKPSKRLSRFYQESDKDDEEYNDDIDINDFGKNGGDDLPNNEYDDDEISILNTLISSEQSAIAEYFDGAKNTKDPMLGRLYADIGSEERFHSEQLLYAKAQLTGEEYVPVDEKVKAEYEELRAYGMDEDTAATTAIDRISLNCDDEDIDDDMKELEEDIGVMESFIAQNELVSDLMYNAFDETFTEYNTSIDTFTKAYQYYQEALDNAADNSNYQNKPQRKISKNPVTLILNGIRMIIRLVKQLISKIRSILGKSKIRAKRRQAWLKRHKLSDLFESGVKLYIYDDKKNTLEFDSMIQYIDLLNRLSVAIGKIVGINIIEFTDAFKRSEKLKPIQIHSKGKDAINEGLNYIKNIVLTPSKIIVTDANKDTLLNFFFGYNHDEKIATSVNGDLRSYNVYGIFERINTYVSRTAEEMEKVIKYTEDLETRPGSLYSTDRNMYNFAVSSLNTVYKGFQTITKIITHDVNEILKIDNGICSETIERDKVDQYGVSQPQQPNTEQNQSESLNNMTV